MDNPTEHNYTTTSQCDTCGVTAEGTMYHCNDAMGIATPVLFQCTRCANPPLIDRIRRRLRRIVVLTKYWWRMATDPKQRERTRNIKRKVAAAKAARVYKAGGPLDLSHFVKQK